MKYTTTITLTGDLEVDDPTYPNVSGRVKEIRQGLRQLAEDLGLQYVASDSEFFRADGLGGDQAEQPTTDAEQTDVPESELRRRWIQGEPLTFSQLRKIGK